jgi:hypothetical protein
MNNLPYDPFDAGQQILKASKKKRVLIAVVLLGASLLGVFLARRNFGAGPEAYLGFIFILPYALALCFFPAWVSRRYRKEQEQLNNWRGHPGRWMP